MASWSEIERVFKTTAAVLDWAGAALVSAAGAVGCGFNVRIGAGAVWVDGADWAGPGALVWPGAEGV